MRQNVRYKPVVELTAADGRIGDELGDITDGEEFVVKFAEGGGQM